MTTMRQTLINDRIAALGVTLGLPPDQAFERLAHNLCTNVGIFDFDDSDLVDGTQDKQIDLLTAIQDEKEATIYIVSVKKTDGFSSTALTQMKDGLDWVFRAPKEQLDTLSNLNFKQKILDVRRTLLEVGYSNVEIKSFFVTVGHTSKISAEFKQSMAQIDRDFNCGIYKSFSFLPLGADELVDLVKKQEKSERAINASISIKYDANQSSLIRYTAKGRKGLICTANASEIARIVEDDETGALFDANVRRFLGKSGAVNSDITATASSPDEGALFWFLNNGITILCDSMDASIDPDDPKVQIKNLQIVNGCQTASSLAYAAKSNLLQKDTHVLLKIFEATDEALASKIVLTTNNQNKITSRDLKANDPLQVDIRAALLPYGLLYEHKLNQYIGAPIEAGKKVVSNERFAQAYLSTVMKKPSDASRRKYKIWSDYYQAIFKVARLEGHVLAYWVVEATYLWAKNQRRQIQELTFTRRILSSGTLHLARIAYEKVLAKSTTSAVSTHLEQIKADQAYIYQQLEEALVMLVDILNSNPVFKDDLDGAFKSQTLDEAINVRFVPKTNEQLALGF